MLLSESGVNGTKQPRMRKFNLCSITPNLDRTVMEEIIIIFPMLSMKVITQLRKDKMTILRITKETKDSVLGGFELNHLSII